MLFRRNPLDHKSIESDRLSSFHSELIDIWDYYISIEDNLIIIQAAILRKLKKPQSCRIYKPIFDAMESPRDQELLINKYQHFFIDDLKSPLKNALSPSV